MRTAIRLAAVGLWGAAAAAALPTAPASATAYRYWTYWGGTANAGAATGWTFSQMGPAATVPADGSTQGWRFAVSVGTSGQDSTPRITPAAAFEQGCGGVAPQAKKKRVAVVLDYGTPADAPPGQSPPGNRVACAVVPTAATGGQVLSAVAAVRAEGGLVCGIGGYPTGECAPAVGASATAATDSGARSPSAAPSGREIAGRTRSSDPSGAPRPAEPSDPPVADSRSASPSSDRATGGAAPAPSGAAGNEPTSAGRGESGSASPAGASVSPSSAPSGSQSASAIAGGSTILPTPSQTVAFAAATAPEPDAGRGNWLPTAAVLLGIAGTGAWFALRSRRHP